MNLLTKNCKKHVFLRGHEVSIPTQIWRDEKRETKWSQHFKGNKVLRLQIKDRLKHGDKIPHRKRWVEILPNFPIYWDWEGSFQAHCISDKGGARTKRISPWAMAPYLLKWVGEIEQRFGVKVRQISEALYQYNFDNTQRSRGVGKHQPKSLTEMRNSLKVVSMPRQSTLNTGGMPKR